MPNEPSGSTEREQPDGDEGLEAKAYTRYWWDCPECGETNDSEDIDPQGETEQCADCGSMVRITGTD